MQQTASFVPINSSAKHREHDGEVHRQDITFQRLGFTRVFMSNHINLNEILRENCHSYPSHRIDCLYPINSALMSMHCMLS